MAGIWDDLNAALAPALESANPFLRDVVPFLGAAEDLLGIDPATWNQPSGTVLEVPQPSRGGRISIGAGGQPGAGGMTQGGGASMDWGGGFDLTTTGRRGLVMYQGQGPPAPGYHLARRAARRPQAGRAGGMYWVPRRTMNPLNPRALLRAERRMASFTHWFKRHFTIQHAFPKRKHSRSKGRFTRRK